MSVAQAKASAELVALRYGPLAAARGGEFRHERFATRLDPLTIDGDIAGSTTQSTEDARGARDLRALLAEVNWPLARRLDDYGDFGRAFSPLVALRWQPPGQVLVRASSGRGFLPPTLFQLNRPRTANEDAVRDPIR